MRGSHSSRAYGPEQFSRARQLLDPAGWFPWRRLRTVLCLAGGGGQQGPLFASLGYEVTVVDLSPEQLEQDRATARRHGLTLDCVEADMQDLSALPQGSFDLVYQPVSSLYVADIRQCYRQVAAVTRPGGLFFSEHWNPVQMQLAEGRPGHGGEAAPGRERPRCRSADRLLRGRAGVTDGVAPEVVGAL